MKQHCEIMIDVPRDRVVALFDDPDNVLKWQPDLLKFEPIAGTPGQPGAKSRLVYKAGKGEFEMIETLSVRNLPDEMIGNYDTKMGVTHIKNRFVDEGASTRWIVETEFKGRGVMKLLAPLMGGMMRKQSLKICNAFKDFAESESQSAAVAGSS